MLNNLKGWCSETDGTVLTSELVAVEHFIAPLTGSGCFIEKTTIMHKESSSILEGL